MSITNISRVNTIDEWRIQTNESANALNTLETGAYEKTAGSLTIKNDASLVITSNGTALQVSNAAQFSTNVTIGKDLYLGARETATGNLTVGKEVVIQGSGNALTVANNATVNNNLQVTKTITTNNVTVNTNVNVTGTTQTGSLIIDSGGIVGTTLVVTGNLTGGNVTTAGATDTGRLQVTNGATVGTTLGVTGNITGGNVTTAGATDTGRLQVTNGATVGTTLGVTGNTTSGNLTTAGATDTGRLQVTNGATVGTTLGVTGNTTSGNLTTTGATDTGRLAVTNGATVGASLSVGTTLSVTGNASASNLNTTGVVGTETLRVNSSGTVGTTLDVTGNTTTGNLNTSGVTNTATLRVSSSASIGTTLSVTGNVSGGNLTTSAVVAAAVGRISETLSVTGNTTSGNLTTTGATDTGRLQVTNGATVGTTLGVTGNITGGNVTTTGATDTGRLQVTNGATIGSTLSVTTSATVGTTLGVTGNITGGNVTTAGATDTNRLQVTNGATVGASLSVGTTLSVTGNTTSGNLTTAGATDTNRLQVTNGATVGGALTVTGAATIGGDLQITGSTIYLGPTLNDTDSIILRGLTRQTPSSGYDYFSVNRTKMPVTLNVTTNTVNTSVAHAFSNGQNVVLSSIVGTTNINPGSTYRVLNTSGATSFFLTTNYGAGNTVVDLTGVNGTATVTDSDNYDAQFRWDEANKIWDIRNTTDGSYSKVLLRSDLSSATDSTSTIVPASSAAVNTVNTRVTSLSVTSPIVRSGDNFSHATSGVTATGYGDSISIPVFVVNATGHVTSVTNTTVRSATTSQTGVVQLTDSVTNTSTTTAATPNAVNTAHALIATTNTAMKSYVDNKFAPLAGAAFTGDVSVTGNLTVTGQTTYMNTNTLNIGDNIITLNADLPSGTAATENAGIEINRGANTNTYLRWDEGIDAWVANNGISGNEYRLANSTTYLAEGTNLYYSNARARAAVSATGSLSYNSSTGEFSYTQGNTNTVSEGTNNLYWTVARGNTMFDNRLASTNTNFLTEGSTNLYWTVARGNTMFDNRLASTNTNFLAEGTTNKYYTDARARDAVSASGSLSYNSSTGVFSYSTPTTDGVSEGSTNLYWTVARGNTAFDNRLADKSTTNLSEGTNLYFTAARVRGNVTNTAPINYNSTDGTFSHASSGVTANTYGSSTIVPVITVNSTGHVTSITNTAISFPAEADTLQTVTGRGATTANAISITNNTPSVNTITGALKVGGGVGVTGNVCAYQFRGEVIATYIAANTGISSTRFSVTSNTSGESYTPFIGISGYTGGEIISLRNRNDYSTNCYATFWAQSEVGVAYKKYLGYINGKFGLYLESIPFGDGKVFDVTSSVVTFYDDIRSTGTVTAGYSDDRLKDKQGNISGALAKVSQINGFYYTANQTAKDLGAKDGMQVGVSSQEVEKVMPEVVVPSALDGYNTVQYEKLVPLLIEAIKELKAEVDELKKNK